jgi:hypothetical protein
MTIALFRAARVTGLVLVALSAFSTAAGAATPPAGAWPVPGLGSPATVRADAGGISTSSVSAAQCPCNPDLPRATVARARSSQCPCNAGLPDGLSGAPVTTRLRTTGSHEMRSGGGQSGAIPAPAIPPRATSIQRHGAFDWADATVGAGVTVVIGLLVAGTVRVVGRRRWHAELAAASRR